MRSLPLLGMFLVLSLLELDFAHGHLDVGTPNSKHGASWRRHMSQSLERRNSTLQPRTDDARFTFYDAGQNACGGYDSNSDFVSDVSATIHWSPFPSVNLKKVVALNAVQWDNGAHCYKAVTINCAGKTTQAKITDQCPGCPYGGLDFSRGLFDFFASEDEGVLSGSWSFGNNEPHAFSFPNPAYTPYSSFKTYTPTSTQWTPATTYTPTSTYSASVSYSSYSSFSSITPSASSYSAPSSSIGSTTSAGQPSATATPARHYRFDQGTLNKLNVALVGVSGLAEAAKYT